MHVSSSSHGACVHAPSHIANALCIENMDAREAGEARESAEVELNPKIGLFHGVNIRGRKWG